MMIYFRIDNSVLYKYTRNLVLKRKVNVWEDGFDTLALSNTGEICVDNTHSCIRAVWR